jgi:hypothetical protein
VLVSVKPMCVVQMIRDMWQDVVCGVYDMVWCGV